MDVIAHPLQIAVARTVHHQGLVAPAEQVPDELVPPVEPRRVSAQEPLHPRHQIGPRRFHHQMKVIKHQTPGMHLPVRLATALAQGEQKQFPILLIPEDRLPPIPAMHHVIDGPRIFDSQLARHPPSVPTTNPVSMFRTDPFSTPFRLCQYSGPTRSFTRLALTPQAAMPNSTAPETTSPQSRLRL